MNTMRMIAIALPMTLLLACGGGGGGGGTAVAPTTMPPTNTPDPMTPPTNMPDPMGDPMMPPDTDDPNTPPSILPTCSNNCEDLPGYDIADLSVAQTRTGGTAPESMTETAIILQLREIATAADTLQIGDTVQAGFPGLGSDIKSNCPRPGKSCTIMVSNIGTLTFSLDDIEELSPVNDATNLVGFDAETRVVMTDNNITFAESRSAARQDDGTKLTFQTYGGWLADSAFGTIVLDVTEGATTTNYFTSFSFGKKEASGSNPEGTGRAEWTGSAVGRDTNSLRRLWQADVTVDIDDLSSPKVDLVFSNAVYVNATSFGLNAGAFSRNDMDLNNGVFQYSSGEVNIWGSFYGNNHNEVGGTLDNDHVVASFGATRQP